LYLSVENVFETGETFQQGDQMGRILAYWVIVYFGHFLNAKVAQILALYFPAVMVDYVLISPTWVDTHFGRFFH
jgi:pimeloyl-ACP methyl ester carboxylesterase